MKMRKLSLNPFLSEKHTWDYLLGLPLPERTKHFDSYGEMAGDPLPRSYYITGKFGFYGYWHCGRVPDWKFNEALHFAHEDCDVKEKWKRMIIWNTFYRYRDERLRTKLKTTKSERARHVISKLLEIEGRHESALSEPVKRRSRGTIKELKLRQKNYRLGKLGQEKLILGARS